MTKVTPSDIDNLKDYDASKHQLHAEMKQVSSLCVPIYRAYRRIPREPAPPPPPPPAQNRVKIS